MPSMAAASGMRPRVRSSLARLALLVAGLTLALVLSEGLLRAFGYTTGRFEAFADIPFKYRAKMRFFNRKENPNWVVTNNWGFHDRHRDPETTGYRILVLGDSFVEGLQVEVERLFTAQLERKLRQQGWDVEVVNAGLGSIGTAHEYLIWRSFFRGRIHVDHILLFFCNGNDLPNNHPFLEKTVNGNDVANKAYLDPEGKVFVVPGVKRPGKRLIERVSSVSVLASTVRRRLYLLKKSLKERRGVERAAKEPAIRGATAVAEERTPLTTEETAAVWRQTATATLRLIDHWQNELRPDGVTFSVVAMPWADHTPANRYGDPRKAAFVARLKELAATRGFGLLELDYGARKPHELFSFDGRTLGHFNLAGHTLVADQLDEWIRTELQYELTGNPLSP